MQGRQSKGAVLFTRSALVADLLRSCLAYWINSLELGKVFEAPQVIEVGAALLAADWLHNRKTREGVSRISARRKAKVCVLNAPRRSMHSPWLHHICPRNRLLITANRSFRSCPFSISATLLATRLSSKSTQPS